MTEKRKEQIAFTFRQQDGRQWNEQQIHGVCLQPTRTAMEVAALRHAAYETALEADIGYSGHSAGIEPDSTPFMSIDLRPIQRKAVSMNTNTRVSQRGLTEEDGYELEEGEEYYVTRPHTSARRSQVSPEEIYQQGNRRYHVRYVDVPPRSSRQAQLPPQREIYTGNHDVEPLRGRQRRRVHPLVWIGAFLTFLVVGWFALNAVSSWFQGVQDDWKYGQHRHFEVNAVIGHSDSPTNPSHFTAENNNGDIYVIELPGGDSSKAKIYPITTVTGNEGNPPVRITFQDVNHDGKLDMIVQIGDPGNSINVILLNNGTTFVSKL